MTTVQEIHNEFYSAEEKLLAEAKAIIDKPKDAEIKKAERFKKLGFGTCKPVTEANGFAAKQAKSKELHEGILYFRQYYPNNKFITEAEVKRICEKYGLVMGDATNYTGDIPEKNLIEIENFNLRQEDFFTETITNWLNMSAINSELRYYESMLRQNDMSSSRRPSSLLANPFDPFYSGQRRVSNFDYSAMEREYNRLMQMASTQQSTTSKTVQPKFKICAPKGDFNTLGYEVIDGFKLVYDPVVLQPVKNGFLIVSAWGEEASDELVVNQKMN